MWWKLWWQYDPVNDNDVDDPEDDADGKAKEG
jgi:hypothetical protein